MKKALTKVQKFIALGVFLAVAGICVLIGLGQMMESASNV